MCVCYSTAIHKGRPTGGAERDEGVGVSSEPGDGGLVERRKTDEDLFDEVVRRHCRHVPSECL